MQVLITSGLVCAFSQLQSQLKADRVSTELFGLPQGLVTFLTAQKHVEGM